MEDDGRSAAAFGNPLGIIRDKCPLYWLDGSPVDPDVDKEVEGTYNKLLDNASHLRAAMGDEMNLINWHIAIHEYANAGSSSRLSLAFWDQDDTYDMGGDHCFLPGGNGRLVHAWQRMCLLFMRGQCTLCGMEGMVCRWLSMVFVPELPQRRLDSMRKLDFGLLNKVELLFPHLCMAGRPLFMALVAGEAAHYLETTPPTDAVTSVLEIPRVWVHIRTLQLEHLEMTMTGTCSFSLGPYPHVAVGASGVDYDILAESVGDGWLFFAGEATTRRYPATMHGPFITGVQEAANISIHATARVTKTKVEKSPSTDAQACASLLVDLFRLPDLEFGSFSVIFGGKRLGSEISSYSKCGREKEQHFSNKSLFQKVQSHFNQQQQLYISRTKSGPSKLRVRVSKPQHLLNRDPDC
ncbi:hypothetical protein VPH35_030677 [Triticum aestivum]